MADRLPTRPPRPNWGNMSKNLALWLLVGLLALALFQMMSRQRNPTQEFSYTRIQPTQLERGNVARVEVFDGKRLEGDFQNAGDRRTAGAPRASRCSCPIANSEQLHQAARGCRRADHWRRSRRAGSRRSCINAAAVDRDLRPLVLPPAAAAGRRQPRLRLREVEGQAAHRRHAEADLRRRGRLPTRPRSSCRRSSSSSRTRRSSPGSAGGCPRARCWSGPPGTGQDAAGQGGGRRGGPPVLLDVGLRLRGDVRRASAPAACATSSSRARRTRPASSSSTRSTPSAGTAAPAWAAGTTSASRRSTSCWSRWTASSRTTASS